jgi:tripartite-type tricarboxylate transporter receptor subunit TctC
MVVLLLVLNLRAPAMQDLVAGQIDLIVADLTTSLPQMRAGKHQTLCVQRQESLGGGA